MAVLKKEELRNQLRRREFATVYTLFGAERYLRDVAVKTIAKYCFEEGDFRDFNDSTFSLGVEGGLQQALAAAQQLPVMASRRVVKVTDVRITQSGYRDTITESHESLLKDYFSDPSPTTILIFIADELNGVKKMGKLLREKTAAVDFEPLKDRELTKWAKDKFKETEVGIDDRVLGHLIARIGPDVARLTNEIAKLATASLPENVVTLELIDSLTANTRELDNFAFVDALVAGRKAEAVVKIRKILDDGAEPVMLIGSLSYVYRRLLIAKGMMESGAQRADVIRATNPRPRDQDSFLAAARRIDDSILVAAIEKIAATDLAIKTSKGGGGPVGSRLQFEKLACELASM